MAGGIGGIGGLGGLPGASGAAHPLSGMGDQTSLQGSLSGLGDLGLGGEDGADSGSGSAGLGLMPSNAPSSSQGSSFADTLRALVVEGPSNSKAQAGDLATRFAAGDTSVDPHQVAIASAKAGVEIQMATRTISSAVSAVRTLFQMQV
jgi:flagellar hook-basal body complex protein FliE